jgi:pimeloyl-ACP methyl ester carboxylesterase
VLLLHGGSGGGANWFSILASLAGEHRVLAPDLPGFGLSDPAPVVRPLSRAAVPALEAVLVAAGAGQVDLCGTSYGGLLAVRLTQGSPGRVRRLALLDSAGLGREAPPTMRLLTVPGLGRLLLSRPSPRSVRWELRTRMTVLRLPPATEDALVAYLTASAQAGSRAWFAHALRAFAGARGQREVIADAELADLHVPTLIAWGERDAFFPASHARRAAALVPRAVLRVVAGAGHSPNWERPGEVAALLSAFFSP